MSDPVTNAEVEDVLSSIRRLVSEDKRPVQTRQAAAQNDRLVLTPSLRVGDPPPVPAENAGSVEADEVTAEVSQNLRRDVPNIDSLVSDDTPVDVLSGDFSDFQQVEEDIIEEDRIPDVDDPVLEPEEIESEVLFDDAGQDYSTDPYGFDDDANLDGEADDSHLKQFYLRDRSGAAQSPTELQDKASSTDVEDKISEVISTQPEEVVPEPERPPLAARNHAEMPSDVNIPAATEEAQAPAKVTVADEEAAQAEDEEKPEEAAVATAPLSAKIAALETAIGQISETWEPEDAGEGDNAGSEAETMAWEDDVPDTDLRAPAAAALRAAFSTPADELNEPKADPLDASAEAETAQTDAHESAAPTDPQVGFDPDEQLIDEEALRDLVSEIVRAELQGALGERITRNVRKLVRREIHRALAAQELE